jgi:hypothetical protein
MEWLTSRHSDTCGVASNMVSPAASDSEYPDRIMRAAALANRVLKPVPLAAGVGGALLACALVLWIHYGTAVFVETIAVGLAGCF